VPGNLVIVDSPPVLVMPRAVVADVINTQLYHRAGSFWHISLNSNNADRGFDVTAEAGDDTPPSAGCDQVTGTLCSGKSFPSRIDHADDK